MHKDNEHHHDHSLHNDHEHSEEHSRTGVEQLKTVILHLIKHNDDHITDLKKWHSLAVDSKMKNVAAEFRKIIRLSEKIERRFNSALKKMERHR